MSPRICTYCNERVAKKVSADSNKYRNICTWCTKRKYGWKEARRRYNAKHRARWERPYRAYLKDACELCGFVPVNKCQLDVDHIDGNHNNNKENNLQTLCANCHRLKTYLNKDWESKVYVGRRLFL